MAIDPKFFDLINAEIDATISAEERATLDEYLAESEAGRSLRNELHSLCNDLDAVDPVTPPAHLKHVILHSLDAKTSVLPAAGRKKTGYWFNSWLGLTTVRYALSFGTGVVLATVFISSDRISRQAFDDVTDLVGTIAQHDSGVALSGGESFQLAFNEIGGRVSLSMSGSIMIIDFDLVSAGSTEIVVTFPDRDIWFNGFAQLESNGTRVTAETGQVTFYMEGHHRYALYLHNASRDATTVTLRFLSSGRLIHEDELSFGKDK